MGEVPVLLLVSSASPRPCDGPEFRHAFFKPHHNLRRRAYQKRLIKLEKEKVRGGVYITQRPVEIEGVYPVFRMKALGQDDLYDVTGNNVFPGLLDRRLKVFC